MLETYSKIEGVLMAWYYSLVLHLGVTPKSPYFRHEKTLCFQRVLPILVGPVGCSGSKNLTH